eukprot:755737-Hanusia_phi.AAC.2
MVCTFDSLKIPRYEVIPWSYSGVCICGMLYTEGIGQIYTGQHHITAQGNKNESQFKLKS